MHGIGSFGSVALVSLLIAMSDRSGDATEAREWTLSTSAAGFAKWIDRTSNTHHRTTASVSIAGPGGVKRNATCSFDAYPDPPGTSMTNMKWLVNGSIVSTGSSHLSYAYGGTGSSFQLKFSAWTFDYDPLGETISDEITVSVHSTGANCIF